jgi:Flp pilus assembly protein TadD
MPLRFPTLCAVATLAVGLSACAGTSEPARTAEAGRSANTATAEALARIADKSLAAGDPVSAVSMLKRAHAIDPDSSAILAELGRNLGTLNAWTEAAEAYRKAVKLAPKDAAIRRGYAGALLALNQPALAEPEYRAALALREDAATLCGLGVTLDLQGRHDDAEAVFRKAYQLDPQSAATRANLALSLALWNKSDEAIGLLAPMAAEPDASAKQRQNLALVFGLAGEMDQAAAVARIDLGEEAVRSNLAYYETLRAMPPVERMRAIMGASAQPPLPPRKPEMAAIEERTPAAAPEKPAAPAAAPRPKRTSKPSRTAERGAPAAKVAAKTPEPSRIPVPEPVTADVEKPAAEKTVVVKPVAKDDIVATPATVEAIAEPSTAPTEAIDAAATATEDVTAPAPAGDTASNAPEVVPESERTGAEASASTELAEPTEPAEATASTHPAEPTESIEATERTIESPMAADASAAMGPDAPAAVDAPTVVEGKQAEAAQTEPPTDASATPTSGATEIDVGQPVAQDDAGETAKEPEPSNAAGAPAAAPVTQSPALAIHDVAALPTTLLPKPTATQEPVTAEEPAPVVAAVPPASSGSP